MSQLIAIATLRLKLMTRQLFALDGMLRVMGTLALAVVVLLASVLIALAGGVIAWNAIEDGSVDTLRSVLFFAFWFAMIVGLFVPLVLTGGVHGLDVSKFVGFPISRRRLFFVSLVSSFGSIEQLFCLPLLVVLFAISFAMPGISVIHAFAIFVILPLVVVAWAHAITTIFKGITRSRRAREALGFGLLVLLVTVSFIPVMIDSRTDADFDTIEASMRSVWTRVGPVVATLPPSLAAEGAHLLREGQSARAALKLAALVPWLLTGLGVGYLFFSKFVLGVHSSGTRRKPRKAQSTKQTFSATAALPFLPTAVVGIASRELLYLSRSVVGRVNLVLLPAITAIIAMFYGHIIPESFHGILPNSAALYGLTMYAVVFSMNFLVNSFAWEGAGFASYLISPVRSSQIILGKNLGVGAFASLGFATLLIAWSVFSGFPGMLTLFTAGMLFLGVLALHTLAGNFLSVRFPRARDISGMVNQPSQLTLFASLAMLVLVALLAGAFLVVPTALGSPWLGAVSMFGFASVSLIAWWFSLNLAGGLLEQRRDHLLSLLESGPD